MRDRLLPAAMLVILAATSTASAGEPARQNFSQAGSVRVAAAEGPQTAALFPGGQREARVAPLPRPLSVADAETYRRILAMQDRGDWAAADREMGMVEDDLLRGYVQARRLLAAGTKSHLPELRAWLAENAAMPQAEAIYRLATATKGGHGLRAPQRAALRGTGIDTDVDGAMWEEVAFDTDESAPRVRAIKTRLRQILRDGDSTRAEAMLASAEIRSLPALDQDRLRLMVASDHFAGGRDDRAAELASASAERSGDVLPAAHWIAGLALWRAGKADQARRYFEDTATSGLNQDWLTAAGAFWAARANLVNRRPEAVNHWMEVAASYPRTFYGLLARSWLGYPVSYAWELPPFTEGDADMLMRVPAARRALALIQLGEREDAEEELRKLYPSAGKAVRQSMLVLAQAAKMPGLTVRLGGVLPRENGRRHDAAAYPLPDWTPQGGWQVDRALVYALVRQESSFNPDARSASGAAGLMQLMPATAQAVGGLRVRDQLTDPAVNLGLGQRYVTRLLSDDPVNGNLMMMAAAYNAGPGTLGRWLQGIRHGEDPLMFVESLPARETRVFVQRVMTSYWVYQARLGQSSPSLEAVASGSWPIYGTPERSPLRVGPSRTVGF
ncbi:lytic transglycosylase domain-containing protein [Magnetospirillum molischianum]|uniref:Putative soluble lytic murein transglycosylase and related regulatory protein n=1 Tax=Magnetospirillum molischianum DSM 120 TaxID=1150626 RepID=H8FMP6_MAGML|nr:lytic transglycosylase domain-containing protein [Magnetospirillum molischianum]CCG39634.1 Putative soluble lytic murein transglycosylase and related regulatory protein [Magnetospirillum molischianum DSM 120]